MLSKKTLRRYIWTGLGVICSYYVVNIQTPLYESNSDIIIKKIDNEENISNMSFFKVNNKIEDITILERYLNSREVFEYIDEKYALRKFYSSNKIDFIQRVWAFNTIENYMDLFRKHLVYKFDDVSGVISIGFLHHDSEISQGIVKELLGIAERKLNSDNKNLTLKQLKFISLEKEKLRVMLDRSINKLTNYQNDTQILDPKENSSNIIKNINDLNSKLMDKKMKLNKLTSYQTDKSIEVVTLRSDIEELEKNLTKLNSLLVGKDKDKLNNQIVDFTKIEENVSLYKDLYLKSLLNLQVLKSEILRKQKVIQVISQPTLPENYSQPRYIYSLFSIWITILILYSLHTMILGILKDRKL